MSSSSTINVTTSSSNDALSKFPVARERLDFGDWLFKAEMFFAAKDMLDVINTPVVPEVRAANDATVYLGVEFVGKTDKSSVEKLQALRIKASKALNYIIQSLHKKQLELVRHLRPLNAYNVMSVLKKNYDIIKSTNTTLSLMSLLNDNRKLSSESMSDYFARIQRMISDLRTVDDSNVINDKMHQTYILNGLKDDAEWKHVASNIADSDVGGKFTVETLQQRLIDKEEVKIAQRRLSSSSSSSSRTVHTVDDVDDTTSSRATLNSVKAYNAHQRAVYLSHAVRNYRPHTSNVRSAVHPSVGRARRGRGSFPSFQLANRPNRVHDMSNVRCYTCGKYGHVSKQCRHAHTHASQSSDIRCWTYISYVQST